MNTPQSQIKLNLPAPLKKYAEQKANKFGVPLAAYIRHLIINDVADMDYPTFPASKATEKAYRQAKKDEKAGKLIEIDDIDTFFNKL